MTRLKIHIPGDHPNVISIETASNEPIKINVFDENNNITESLECLNGIFSTEGSDSNKHFENYRRWEKYKGVPLLFHFKKSSLYTKAANSLRLGNNILAKEEKRRFEHIVNAANTSGKIHDYIYHDAKQGIGLSECDFINRDYGRLLYWADDNPACIYFGYVLLRSDKTFNGHIIPTLAQKVVDSILIAKHDLIRELKKEAEENAGRRNTGN
jgi:hypothetical protein